MKKIKKIFNYLLMSFAFLGITSGTLLLNGNGSISEPVFAEFTQLDEVSNNLPAYLKVSQTDAANKTTSYYGNNAKEIFLVNTAYSLDINIGDKSITKEIGTEGEKTNPAYYLSEIATPREYYYFDFTTSLSLYHNLSNTQIEDGSEGENLLLSEKLPLENYTTPGEFAITESASFTPMSLDLSIKLNTNNESTTFKDNSIILNQEGCYTLVIPVLVYHTQNDGQTFTLLKDTTIKYTFMLFNSSTYFKSTGEQNVEFSSNLQKSTIRSSETYSNYYFYNYAYAGSVNTLPSITYNPKNFKLNVRYTDIDDNIISTIIEYQNDHLVCLNPANGEEKTDNNINVLKTKDGQARITFKNLGEYDIEFDYLYVMNTQSKETTFLLPFDENLIGESFKDKAQKVVIYGYQAMYSDYADVDPFTNQPTEKEIKTFKVENDQYKYNKTADITSLVNNTVNDNTDATVDLDQTTPHSNSHFSISELESRLTNYLNSEKRIDPVSSNQPPIKFISNVDNADNLANDNSRFYQVNYNSDAENNKYSLTEISKFQNLNQNEPGTYAYIIQYQYDNFMTSAGILVPTYYHYQIFYFTITNTAPSVSVFSGEETDAGYENFEEIYTRSFTNKDVFILNNAQNNAFDAEVDIRISAYNYNTGVYFFRNYSIEELSKYSANLEYTTFDYDFDGKGKQEKQGILIKSSESYANARFTITIYAKNIKTPSVQSFTIDTEQISNVSAYNVEKTNTSTYIVEEKLSSSSITNRSIALAWNKKNSGAQTYGYLKHIPFDDIAYYPNISDDNNDQSNLLFQLINDINMLPVSSQINLDDISAWSEYQNSIDYTSVVPATYVRSDNGIYILQVFDEAGNNTFEIFMIDKTSPVFVQVTEADISTYELLYNSKSISVPGSPTQKTYIKWAGNKGIKINGSLQSSDFQGYEFGVENVDFQSKYNEFITGKTLSISSIYVSGNYNGVYFTSAINDRIYIKERSSIFTAKDLPDHQYQVVFTEGNKALEGTYKILLRDESNAYNYLDEAINYINYPSSYVSFNVTSDMSKLEIYEDFKTSSDLTLDIASYDQVAPLFKGVDGKYSTDTAGEESVYTVKNSYRTPTNTKNGLYLSFIPLSNNGTKLQYVHVTYYPYETKSFKQEVITGKEDDTYLSQNNYIYYKDISSKPAIDIDVYKASTSGVVGQTVTYPLTFAQGSTSAAPGKYIIERQYSTEGLSLDKYDFFRRTITFYVDTNGLISSPENVKAEDGGETKPSLESVIGGDLILNMHSLPHQSDISVSFPKYNDAGLNFGSLFTKTSFADEYAQVSTSLTTDKLPLSLHIPKYKYTVSSIKNSVVELKQITLGTYQVLVNGQIYRTNLSLAQANTLVASLQNRFTLTENKNLSYYGDVQVVNSHEGEEGYSADKYPNAYQILIEGVLYESNLTQEAAWQWVYDNLSISDYEISALVEASLDNGTTQYYRSKQIAGSTHQITTLDYLDLYKVSGAKANDYAANVTEKFSEPGTYTVTLTQGNPQSKCYSIYKFQFVIKSNQPDFDIFGSNGYKINAKPDENSSHYYTNSDTITMKWQDPTDPYLSKIDQDNIYIGSKKVESGIISEGSSYSFKFNVQDYITGDLNTSSLTITLQFEGHDGLPGQDGQYYKVAKKTIHFDTTAPTKTLTYLMEKTASATGNTLNVDYQKKYMRVFSDHNGAPLETMEGASYINNQNSGYFENYAFTVSESFFEDLKNSFLDESNNVINGSEIAEIYYSQINDIASYNQSGRESVIAVQKFDGISSGIAINTKCYYEIVEMDYAGNMTVYVVYVTDDVTQSTENAISYINKENLDPSYPISISNKTIEENKNGFNIYSNSGFELIELNYNQDPWLYFELYTKSNNKTAISRFLKTPTDFYRISKAGTGELILSPAEYKEVISSSFESSSNKHFFEFANRTLGEERKVYISIMDSSLTLEKYPASDNTASIKINVPTASQVKSDTTAYVFPTKIEIYTYNATAASWSKTPCVLATQKETAYDNWEKMGPSAEATDFAKINAVGELIVSIVIEPNVKVKFVVTDNFGNSRHIIVYTGSSIDEKIGGNDIRYSVIEGENITYISKGEITYTYNDNLYEVNVEDINKGSIKMTEPEAGNIKTYKFTPPASNYYDGYFKITVKDDSNLDGDPIKIIFVRIYNRLPSVIENGGSEAVGEGGIVFLDKNYANIENEKNENINTNSQTTVVKDGKTFSGPLTTVFTYSSNVTLVYKNSSSLLNENKHFYNKSIPFSLYISKDGGIVWEKIEDSDGSETSYTISGVGKYLVIAHYDLDSITTTDGTEVLGGVCRIFEITIPDPDEFPYYYVSVDGKAVAKSTGIKYTTPANQEIDPTYIVAVDFSENHRVVVHENNDKNVSAVKLRTYYLDFVHEGPEDPDLPSGTIAIEHWYYSCGESRGDFAIIYIPKRNDIAGTLTYTKPSGETQDLKDRSSSSWTVPVNNKNQLNFNQLKITYSSYYGIPQNMLKLQVYKFFNGSYKLLDCPSYRDDELSYTLIEMSGSYRLKVVDSTNSNMQDFNGKDYVDLIFLSSVPFEVVSKDNEGNEVVTAPIQRAIYNSEVTLRLINFTTYYQPQADFKINVTRNGLDYEVSASNYNYTFSQPGYYTVKFSAVSMAQSVQLREETFAFTIINKNESRYAFEFSKYKEYYIETVLKDGVDVTQDLLDITNFDKVTIGGKEYLSSISLNHIDQKTGSGRYSITVNVNDKAHNAVLNGGKFTFDLWINVAKPPISVSLSEGESTTDPINVSFNVQNLYNSIGDCYIIIAGRRIDYTADTIADKGMASFTIKQAGTHYIQVYTQSGNLLYSYKVTKNEPLNTFAILAIILGVIAVGAIVFITIKLRKRQKVK